MLQNQPETILVYINAAVIMLLNYAFYLMIPSSLSPMTDALTTSL